MDLLHVGVLCCAVLNCHKAVRYGLSCGCDSTSTAAKIFLQIESERDLDRSKFKL
jgi:hypothetical protein